MTAYYNEFDPKAAAWLRQLIADGLIAPGEVDERDIRDVRPDELRPFRQCHFFAGIGGWSLALRQAGWRDDEPAWTASCPCQPFSAAGGRTGFADERHLWPAFYHLASQCRPDVVLGEQSASKDGLAWIDLVSSDMEAAGYSGGALDLCSAGFGAPNIRQRLYFVWMADAADQRHERSWPAWRRRDGPANDGPTSRVAHSRREGSPQLERGREQSSGPAAASVPGGMAHPMRDGARPVTRDSEGAQAPDGGALRCLAGGQPPARHDRPACRLADANGRHPRAEGLQRSREHGQRPKDASDRGDVFSGAARGFWRDADWVLCRDDDGPTWRPVEPGSFPLATGVPGRMALIRGAGNAINVEVATGFIEAVRDVMLSQRQEAA